jgi:carbonic anhydrase
MTLRNRRLLALCGIILFLPSGCGTQTAPLDSSSSNDATAMKNVNAANNLTEVSAETGEEDAESAATHAASGGHGEAAGRPADVSEALAILMEGNQRFVDGKSIHPHESADYRASLAREQHPFATVLTCSDSRVTPVLIFDQGIGDLFVIRVAGNVIDEDVAGSIEYAVDHLGAKLLVILGHENCGAVTAAYHSFVAKDLKKREPHEIESLLMHIQPALRNIDRSQSESEQIAAAVEANVREAIQELLRLPDVQQAQDKGLVKIVGAIYSVRTGAVRLLDM